MNKHPSILHSGVFTLALFLSLAGGRLDAGSATWNLNPVSGIWNDPTNWTPAAEPNSFADTATFGLSNTTSITLSAGTRLDGIVFNAGASAFTIATTNALPISPALTLSGAGITNSSGIIQNFMTAGGGANNGGPSQIFFRNSATAGSMTNYTSSGGIESTGFGGGIFFYNTSTAGSGTFLIKGSAVAGADGGFAVFNNTSSAGNGVFTNNGAVVGGIGAGGTGAGGLTEFDNTASAANGTFINNGGTVFDASGGRTHFFDTSTAGNGTFTSKGAAVVGAFGGVTGFLDGSNAGTGHFTTDGGAVGGARGAFASFNDTASAASGTFTTNGGAGLGALGGETDFFQTSTAGNATLIANAGTGGGNGGSIGFFSSSTGGTATVKVFGNGKLDISTHTAPGVTVGSIEGTGNVFLGSRLLTVGSNDLSTIFSGVIQNGGSFTKIGTGALTLSGVNTYTGATAVNAGALIVNGALNVASAVSVESGATLGGSGAVNGAVTVKDGGILAPGAAGSPGTFTLGSLVLNPTSNLNFRLGAPNVVGGASNDLISVTGALTLDGILNVTDSGAFGTGTYRLINYGGALMDQGLGIGVVPAGFNAGDFTIQISVANQVNLVVGTTALFWDGAQTVANGVVNGGSGDWNTTMTNWTTASGATNSAWNNQFAVFSGAAGGAVTLKESVSTTGMQFATASYTIGADPGQSITLNGATTFRVDAGLAATINAPLTGAGSLTKTDTGALTLGGANTYTGLTTVTAGTVKLGAANAIKSGNALTTAAAGIFDLNGNAQTLGLLINGGNVTNTGASATLTIGNDSLGAGSFTGAMNVIWNQGASSTTLTGSWSNVGDITLNANGAGAIGLATGIVNNIGTVTNSGLGNGSILISAAIGTSVTGVIQDSATSPLILNSANTFTGGLKIQQGTVQVGNAAGVGAGLVTLGSAGHSATLDLNGQTETILSLATAGVAANQTIGNSSTTTNAVLNYTGATTSTFGGVIQNVLGGGNKTTGLTVNNAAASLMLSGVNTYTGATTVSAGSVFVNGSLANGPVSVASGATLGGIGTLGGAVTVANGGKLAPGVGGPGTLTVGSLILNGVANLNFDLGTPGVLGGVNDLLQVTGSLTLDGNLNIANAGGFGFGSYRLINFGGALTNNGLVLGTTPAGFTGDFTVQTSVAGQVNLIVSPASGILFWDGSQLVANGVVNGGSGIWDNSRTNWTNAAGTAQSAWAGGMAVFTGAAGTVSLSENVATTGMQFSTTGYAINSLGGKTIALTGAAALRVDSGKAATINAPLTGGGSLTKTDTGTLILTGNNSYTGGTTVVSGFLTVRNAAGLGLGSGPVTVLASLGSNLIFDTNSSAGSATITNKGSGSNNLGVTSFIDTSTAGSATIINEGNTATGGSGGLTFFRITSRAGAATINNLGAGFSVLSGTGSGGLQFIESSTADSATITNFAGLGNGLFGGGAEFAGGASAGTATITNRGGAVAGARGGTTQFINSATASAATLIAEGGTNGGLGGTIVFNNTSSGGTARVIFNPGDTANGSLDISGLTVGGTTLGSIEGAGRIFLGANGLLVGINNLSTEFSGTISDGGASGGVGKSGTGRLTLSGNNTYFGSTNVFQGELAVRNPIGMGLGTGPVGVLPGARLLFIDNALAGANTISVQPSTSNLSGGHLVFLDTASAGSATIQQRGSTLSNVNTAAETSFFDSSSAGTANFTNFGGKANNSAHGGVLRFRDNSTAATATINNRGAEVAGAYAGFTQFYESSTAGAARITNFGTASKTAFGAGNGGDLGFFRQANAGSATIVNQGATANGGSPGTTGFSERSSANQASITNAGGLAAAAPGGRTTFRGDVFSGASTAGGATILNGRGTVNGASGGLTQFLGTSTAGTSRVTNEGAKNSGGTQGRLDFKGTSNAGNASITNEGAGLANTLGGQTKFIEGTSAASATLMNLAGTVARAGGGAVNFESTIAGQTSTAGSATITNSGAAVIDALGGQTIFSAGSTAGGGTILNRGAQVANPTPIVGYNSGLTFFTNGGTAGAASFTNEGGTVGNALGGLASFSSGSSAGSASFLNKAATVQGGNGGGTQFFNATASTATFTNEGGRFFFGFGGLTEFRGAATAGAATLHNAAGQVSLGYGGSTSFIDTSTAGAATITNDGSAVSGGLGARTTFGGSAQAGTSAILNRAGTVSGAAGGSTIFADNARAGQSVIHNQGATVAGAAPGSVFFVNSSTAGGATLYADAGVGAAGGSLIFSDTSEGGTARAIIGGGGGASPGGLDISQLTDGSMFIGSIEGGGIVSLGRKGLAIGTNNLTTTFDGVIRDGGVVNQTGGFINKIGTGALTLNGDNTFTGLTYILRGLLRVNGSLAGGAYVQFATLGGNGTIAGGVTVGPGGIVNPGASPGTLTVVGDYLQQAGGALQLEIGGLNPADSDHLIATGKLTLGGILELDFINGFAPQAGDVFNLLTFGTLAGQFSGVELVGIAQGWQFTLDPAGTALGLTSLSNAVSVPEFLVRPGPNIVLSGGGQIAPGVPVHFLGGTLEAASDAVLDNPVIVGLAGAIFQSDAGTDSTLSGVLSGPGALTKTGPGSLTLPAANTFTGDTFIADGSLFVDGSLASPNVFVLAAGLLGGNGTLLGNVFNSGIVSPGHSPGTLHIGGNFTQSPAGTLRIEVGGLAAGQSDRLTIGGHASLDGTVQFIRLDNFTLRRGDRLEFLTAAQGVSGKFATVLNSFATGTILEPRVTYGPTSVALEMVQGSFAEFAGRTGLAPNQRAVAQALDSAAYDPRAEQLIAYLDARLLEKLPGDFELIAPEELASIFNIGTSLAQVQAMNLQRRMADLRAGANGLSAARLSISDGMPDFSGSFGMAGPRGHESNELNAILAPAPDNRWGVFVSGVGEWVNVGDTRDARGYDFTTGGITLGIDYKVSANFAVGLSAGYTGTSADLANDGRVGVTGGKLGLYATAFAGGFYADVAVTGGYNSYDTRRTALQGTARGSTSGADLNVLFGAGYDWKRGGLTIGPTATFNYTYVGLDGFTESGSLAPLAIQDRHGESLRSAFGIRVSYDWKVRDGLIIRPEIRAAWQHEFGDASYDVSARFANGAGNVFTVNGPRIGRDSALLGAGITVQWNARCSTYLSYDGQIGRANYDSHSISGGMRIAF